MIRFVGVIHGETIGDLKKTFNEILKYSKRELFDEGKVACQDFFYGNECDFIISDVEKGEYGLHSFVEDSKSSSPCPGHSEN